MKTEWKEKDGRVEFYADGKFINTVSAEKKMLMDGMEEIHLWLSTQITKMNRQIQDT
jgi:hypothetical protein